MNNDDHSDGGSAPVASVGSRGILGFTMFAALLDRLSNSGALSNEDLQFIFDSGARSLMKNGDATSDEAWSILMETAETFGFEVKQT
ncbi:hypothetical protein SAMN05216548_1309 [Faunimonas pinastri]|uniref:Uncharacterized protein n=1 Tax=Faunimonas pinastri TaxID=1855383 RepID=A0A1H9QMS8_9HYPH|nr:hypothetical protein [Faunimonas pinastri]SER61159.1 hypothetical protein SAMN05216548_1309 [Faunimonas pinastri]